MIHYDKLVRDKIPSIIEASGKTAVTDRIPPENMQAALDRKLQEEVCSSWVVVCGFLPVKNS